MSSHLRFCFAAFLLAGLSTSPASPNPFDALFNSAPAEATAPAPAPAEEDCLPQPGKSTADGQHWVYRFDGHRKCWFQAAEATATVKKRVRHHAAQKHVAAPKENESALRKRKAVVDARDELLRSAQAETPQPPPAPEIKVVIAAPDPATGAAALEPPPPAIAKPATDQFTSDRPAPRQLDVETLLAAARPASDAVATSVSSAAPAAISITEAGDDEPERTATWLGVMLIGLGLVSFLVGASQTLRGCFAGRAISPPEDGVGGHRGRLTPEPSFAFGPISFNRPATGEELY
jgi:hypothetical protein